MITLKGIHMIECGGICCYIIRGKDGDVLIDTGLERYRDHVETWLLNYDVKLIILTHGHAAQIQNAGYFSELYGAPIMISPYDMRLSKDNTCRPYYVTNPVGKLFRKQIDMNMHLMMNRFDPRIFADDGMDLSPYGIDGVVLNLEGHTKGSIGVLCKGEFGFDLYCGDALMNFRIPMFPIICESPSAAKRTIEKIVTISPDRIMVGHGEPILKGSPEYKLFIDRY